MRAGRTSLHAGARGLRQAPRVHADVCDRRPSAAFASSRVRGRHEPTGAVAVPLPRARSPRVRSRLTSGPRRCWRAERSHTSGGRAGAAAPFSSSTTAGQSQETPRGASGGLRMASQLRSRRRPSGTPASSLQCHKAESACRRDSSANRDSAAARTDPWRRLGTADRVRPPTCRRDTHVPSAVNGASARSTSTAPRINVSMNFAAAGRSCWRGGTT